MGHALFKVGVVNADSPLAVRLRHNDWIRQPVGITNLADEAGSEPDDILALQSLPAHLLPNGPRIREYGQVVLDHLPRDPGHVGWLPCKHISVCPEEGDEHEFLFGVKRSAHLHGLGRVGIQENPLDWASVAGRNPGSRLGELPLIARWLVGDRRGVHQPLHTARHPPCR